ncbi:hypothetical protein ACS0TY_027034 [Phlomoides rotata]
MQCIAMKLMTLSLVALFNHVSISIRFVYRNANMLAHSFARASISFSSSNIWDEPPGFVDGLLDSICHSCE